MKTFRQFVNSKRVYHLDIDSHPLAARPTWAITHSRDGPPVPYGIAAVETSTDGMSVRLTTHEWAGSVTITATVGVHPRTTASESFQVEILPVPGLSPELKLAFSQHRDRPL
jgi:hypothetical protein